MTSGGNSLFDRSYGYDNVGNVQTIVNNQNAEQQTYAYDPLDRLTNWDTSTSVHEQYVYDAIGNLTSKAGTAYIYGSTNSGPHQAKTVGGQTYSYDANGNLTSGGNRSYTWNAENQPTAISSASANESYAYDADGQRVSRSAGVGPAQTTTYYIGGMYEFDSAGNVRSLYQFNGQTVAQRSGSSLYYLHGDHLGSVSLTTDAKGRLVSSQEFKPWGEVRSGSVAETKLNYTGQKKDDTGLLYYNARYYDPVLARFVSADSIVPGAAMGAGGALGTLGMDNASSMKGLTVDYHEPGFATSVGQENTFTALKGFYFQLSSQDKQLMKNADGPINPQTLNRYSYVVENPLRFVDLTGHNACPKPGCGGVVYNKSRSQSVMVFGSFYDPNHTMPLQPGDVRQGDYILGWRELKPGQSSIDIGMGDVDLVQAVDNDHAIACDFGNAVCGTNYVYKLNDNEKVTISDLSYPEAAALGFRATLRLTPGPKDDLDFWGNLAYDFADKGWKLCGPDHCKTDPYWFSRSH